MFSSSGHGKKPPSQQQEMVQVDRADSASPFWRAPPREPAGKKGGGKSGGSSNSNSNSNNNSNNMRDPTKVVGAAYSHADLLKFDSLSLSGSPSRPRSPPPSTSHKTKTHGSGSSSSGSKAPPFRNYKSFLSNTDEDWNADEEEDVYGYDEDDGDDFGLPSLSNMKRRTRRMAAAAAAAQSGSGRLRSSGDGDVGWGAVEEADDGIGSRPPNSATQQQQQRPRRYSNSADIAVERPAPSYPVPKKSEGKILRPQYKDILRDPANALHLISHAAVPAGASAKEAEAVSARISRINKFKKLLQASTIPLPELRALAWSGIPHEVRAMTWQLLLSYLPTSSERRVAALERKRREYLDGVRQAFDGVGGSSSGGGDTNSDGDKAGANRAGANRAGANRASAKGRGLDEAVWHQISIDVPRTNPHMELYGFEATQRSLERILYVWAVRHPASGYVQGINDLVTPFWQVFLGVYISDPNIESGMDPGQLPRAVLDAVEADSFWCLTKLLDGIQDHYIVAQPGIQRQVAALRDLTARIDSPLARHLEDEHVEFIQFSFRWMNCLLMREISVKNTIRMWDTYMAEENGFSEFHLYVCAAFLVKWSAKLCGMDFQEIMMFLQSLPTREWTEKDIELLLSEAYIWQSLFKGSSAHLRRPASRAPSTNLQL